MPIRVAIEISGVQPLQGRLRRDGEPWQPFVGWVSLATLIGNTAERADAGPPPPPGDYSAR